MEQNIREVARLIKAMDRHLRNDLLKEKQVWSSENFARHQDGVSVMWALDEHVRAMIYSMLSAGRVWATVEEKKGKIEEIFFNFDAERIIAEPPKKLEQKIKDISCGNRRIKHQMKALRGNIEKLKSFAKQCGSIEAYYQQYVEKDPSYESLVRALCSKENRMVELGVPLISEYLRNIGYDILKPDTHIKRILGNKILACSEHEIVPDFDVFKIIAKLARESDMPAAEIDYILWAYCADNYGAICTVKKPKCKCCVARDHCNRQTIVKGVNMAVIATKELLKDHPNNQDIANLGEHLEAANKVIVTLCENTRYL